MRTRVGKRVTVLPAFGLAGAIVSLCVSVAAQPVADPKWNVRSTAEGSIVTPEGVPAGKTFQMRIARPQAVTGDLAAWLDAQVARDASVGSDERVQTQAARTENLNGLPMVTAYRVRRAPEGLRLVLYHAGRLADGRVLLFRTETSPDRDVAGRFSPAAGAFMAGLLRSGSATAGTGQARRTRAPSQPAAAPSLPAYAVAPGTGVKPGDIDRVLIDHQFFMSPTGLMNTHTIWVLLKDGRALEDPVLPLEDTDLSRVNPNRVARWTGDPKGVTIGKTRFAANDVGRCRAARPGETLDRNYSQTGGATMGTTVTFVGRDLNFRANGTYSQASAVAIGGDGFGGGGTTGSGGGRYRLDGYTVQFEPEGRPVERRFFCVWGDKTLFVASAFWFSRSR